MLNKLKNGIGVFGGSFDPPHKGHVQISKIALKKFKLKKVLWIVTKKNPFKKKSLFTLEKRILMSKKALKKFSNIKVLHLEKILKSNRTIDLVNYLVKTKKQNNLYIILGADNLINFHKWTKWKKIVKLVKLIVFSRKGYDKKSKNSTVVKYLNKKNIIFVKNKHINISSSIIKKKLL